MFAYLSKKVAIPNNVKLRCVRYNQLEGFIACGGEDCLLKVLRLETKEENPKVRGLAANSSLTMNQALDGHKGPVTVLAWNEKNHKLTSGDQNGLIIVWVLHKGVWYEEMVNNRAKSVVRSMQWNGDGSKICIAYEDGAIILGSVDGNRLWGKELKITLTHLEWSPNGRMLLFGTSAGEIHHYDLAGEFVSKVIVYCQSSVPGPYKVAAIKWYNGSRGYFEPNCATLAICFTNGRCQLMQSDLDDDPILLDTKMNIVDTQWNTNGSILAVAGQLRSEKDCNLVSFYSPRGEQIRILKVSGKEMSSCSWESSGLRLAISVDSYIYFANIRPNYRWTYFADTLVYAFTKPDQYDYCVVFWNTKKNETHSMVIKNLISISSGGDFCCIITRCDEISQPPFVITLYNTICTPLDSKCIELVPLFVAMTANHVVVTSREAFYMWQFKNVKQRAIVEVSNKLKAGMEKLYHIDDVPSGVGGETIDFNKALNPTQDPICAVCMSDKLLLVARESGSVNQYTMPSLSLTNKVNIRVGICRMALNCTSSRLAHLDGAGILKLSNIDSGIPTDNRDSSNTSESLDKFERRDVWDMKWAEDNGDLFAVMEKMRLQIFNKTEPEDPANSSGFICQFKDLQVKSVSLDEIMAHPEQIVPDNVYATETKSLRDTRAILHAKGLDDAVKFVEANSHPELWRILAEASFEKLNLKVAEHAFVRCKDYAGIQLVKRLGNLQNESLKRAEISAYFGRYDEAEKLYLDLDRRDLAVGFRKKLGDWFRVLQLLKTGSSGDDHQMEEASNAIGNYYADRQKWQQAVPFFVQGRNQERLAKCYYRLEDYNGLKTLTDSLPENHKLLQEIAEMFVTVGMCQEAVEAYTKCNKVQQAIDACVQLNQWSIAIELAQAHNVREVEPLLVKYAETLIEKNKMFDAIELYRKANHYLDAAKIMYKVAQKEAKNRGHPLRVKKLFLLAALLVEQYHDQMKSTSRAKAKKRGPEAANALAGLLAEDVAAIMDTKVIDGAWRGAEAYHFYMLAQRQLYAGNVEAALKTSLHLRDFEDFIDPVDVYSLLGLSASAGKAFATCSMAFYKLETLESLSAEQRQQYEDLAVQIFSKFSPKDLKVGKVECPTCAGVLPDISTMCSGCETKFPTCIVSGRPLYVSHYWTCPVCKHQAYPFEIEVRKACPLCHTRI